MSKDIDFPYVHGFSKEEQDRLRHQSEFTEYTIYQDIDFSNVENLLEVGCGVGAQSDIILRRFPRLKLTGIDLNEKQLETAQKHLAAIPHYQGRYDLKKMDAASMDFKSNSFDGAFLCWVLEHMPNPKQVLSEVRRVLRPGSTVVINEVMNHSFFLDPYSPNIWKYWMAFNDYQYDNTGDPFIGAKLGNLLNSIGLRDIQTKVKTWHFDNRQPDKRKDSILFWNNLTMSAAPTLMEAGLIDEELVKAAKKEFTQVANDPNAVFYFSFMQATARNI